MSDVQSIVSRRVLHRIAGMDSVELRRDLEYGSGAGALTFDLYRPPAPVARRTPAVVVVAGYPDPGFKTMLGCRFKEMGSTASWSELIAASGMSAIAYANEEPARDLLALLRHVRANADVLQIDADRIGLWASSGNAPLALAQLMRDAAEPVACAALCYGYTLDLDGTSAVADAARTFGFANPCTGRKVEDLARVPLFVARAGQDATPGLNDSLDRFVAHALAANLPLSLVNHPDGPHAFELFDDGAATRAFVEQVLAFLHGCLYSAATTVIRG